MASTLQALASGLDLEVPQAQLVWSAAVTVGERESLGAAPGGERFIVPILGGEFWGAEGHAALSGTVLAGGADRQLLRSDGVKELDALYEMRCADGTTLTVRNRVLIDEPAAKLSSACEPLARYARSRVQVTAPAGAHAWLNRRLLVGTLQSLRPHAAAVLVRVWCVS